MNHIDLKYSNILSARLDMFKVKQTNPYRANFRCPICGDSQKSKTKARGWILEKDNSALFYCHNCGASLQLRNLLKAIDTNLYNEYVVDSLLEKNSTKPERVEKVKPLDKLTQRRPKFEKKRSPLKGLTKISSLAYNHSCRKYIDSRKIPANQHYRMYYASKFTEWVNSVKPDALPEARQDHSRLVLPFIDKRGNVFGFNARAFSKDQLRYITIMLDDRPKIFGLDQVDMTKKYFVVEGPIDSLFINNCVAMAGAEGNFDSLDNPENAVFVFDNEPRNKDTVSRMSRCIKNGYRVCIWPEKLLYKDINDMVLSGISCDEIQNIINSNTHKELEAELKLSYWRKC